MLGNCSKKILKVTTIVKHVGNWCVLGWRDAAGAEYNPEDLKFWDKFWRGVLDFGASKVVVLLIECNPLSQASFGVINFFYK